jgi:hypothetical protein
MQDHLACRMGRLGAAGTGPLARRVRSRGMRLASAPASRVSPHKSTNIGTFGRTGLHMWTCAGKHVQFGPAGAVKQTNIAEMLQSRRVGYGSNRRSVSYPLGVRIGYPQNFV